jgi:hypothetical protein
MENKRQFDRFDPVGDIVGYFELKNEVTGQFRNSEEFLIRNISSRGFNLLSNYSPNVGNVYQIFVDYDGKKVEFEIKIVHSRIFRYLKQQESIFRSGVVYSHGCQILSETQTQINLVQDIIQNECQSPDLKPAQ